MQWYMQVWKKYAVFTGRAHRTEYWMFVLFNLIISIGLALVEVMLMQVTNTNQSILSNIYSLAVLIPSVAVGIRRMHDTDRSGWWVIVPIANIVFAATEGTRGDNRFGPDPKGAAF
jgi:uncharacterized membrane protein YhaH (DUF805 family)